MPILEYRKGMQVGTHIDSWLMEKALTVTGLEMHQIPDEDQRRFTYARRHGGFGFSSNCDLVHGAYTGFLMEALYPAGIGADGDPKDGDFSIRDISNVFKRVLPHRTYRKDAVIWGRKRSIATFFVSCNPLILNL